MNTISMIGLDLAKTFIQAHAVDAAGKRVFSKKLSRARLLPFLAAQPRVVVAMEACAGAHHVARQAQQLGHKTRLVPPLYVKPFVKRGKSDRIDAEAIVEAAQRPNMRFVAVKSQAQQAAALVFSIRDLFVRQRTQTVNALRGHLAEFGLVAPRGREGLCELTRQIERAPAEAQAICSRLVQAIAHLDADIAELDGEIARASREDEVARRLKTVPGVGPILATAAPAFAPPPQSFRRGRDFAAWLGLAPLPRSTGGRDTQGRTSKRGQRTLRKLFLLGAAARVNAAVRHGRCDDAWLKRMLETKPRMLVIAALANRTARRLWAVWANNETYRAQAA